jgi:amidase/allophanate hydrolase
MAPTGGLTINALRAGYARGARPLDVVTAAIDRILDDRRRNAWIYVEGKAAIEQRCADLEKRRQHGDDLPLYGIPFGVKDNIDVAEMPTSAACPEFTYPAARSSRAVELLTEKGAICVGKTNLDQFATGLSGARSPYGVCASVQNTDYVSGGSSSGSAVAVAAGHVPFALGTDTGGSGRIPAGFNDIVGIKPTLGKVSLRGVVPNCATLDVVSVFATDVSEGSEILREMSGHDPDDPYSRQAPPQSVRKAGSAFAFGRLAERDLEFFGLEECRTLYQNACDRLTASGGQPVEIDFTPFRDAGQLLFDGPWIAERKSALRSFASEHPSALLDVTKRVLSVAERFSGVDVFDGIHLLARLKRKVELQFALMDFLLVPTAPRPYRIDDMLANPIELNSQIGYYSYFAHLLDLCAVAVPNGTLTTGVPMGVTLLAPAWHDEFIASLARKFENPRVLAAAE